MIAAMITTIIIPTRVPKKVFFLWDTLISFSTFSESAEMFGTERYPIAPHRTIIRVDVISATRLFRDFVFIYIMNEKILLPSPVNLTRPASGPLRCPASNVECRMSNVRKIQRIAGLL